MDLLVLIGAILGLYVVVALIIYGPRLGRRDDDATTQRNARNGGSPSARPRKDWRQYWL
jgi:hypothetical protein